MGTVKGIPYEVRQQHDEWGNAPQLLAPEDRAAIEADGSMRVGNGMICAACGKDYEDHPAVVGALWLTRLCDGRMVKL